jgi:hypothetical protein
VNPAERKKYDATEQHHALTVNQTKAVSTEIIIIPNLRDLQSAASSAGMTDTASLHGSCNRAKDPLTET